MSSASHRRHCDSVGAKLVLHTSGLPRVVLAFLSDIFRRIGASSQSSGDSGTGSDAVVW